MVQETRQETRFKVPEAPPEPPRHEAPYVPPPAPTAYMPTVTHKPLSWGALFAGAFTAISVQTLLMVLGIAIGATAVGADAMRDPQAWTIGMGVWWLIAGIISLFAGGWVAGRMCGIINGRVGAIHGFMTWAFTTVIAIILLGTAAGGLVAGGLAMMTAPGEAAVGQQQIQAGFGVRGGGFQEEFGVEAWRDRDPRDQPAQPRQQREPGFAEMPAPEVAEAIAGASWWTFFALLLGAGAASVGGWVGVPRTIPGTTATRR